VNKLRLVNVILLIGIVIVAVYNIWHTWRVALFNPWLGINLSLLALVKLFIFCLSVFAIVLAIVFLLFTVKESTKP